MIQIVLALQQTDVPVGIDRPMISLQALLSTAIVVVLIAAAAWALRKSTALRRAQLPIVVETAVALGERRSLVVVSVEGRRLLLGLTPTSVGLVTELKTGADFGKTLDASLTGQPS